MASLTGTPVSGVGTIFRRWDGSAYQDIGQINSISGPTMTRNTIDTTSLDTTGGYRTFIAGFRDPGTITLNMNFTRDTYEVMKDDFESDTEKDYEILLPDVENTSLNFSGLVTELPLDIPTDDKVTANVTIKISGQVSLNSGSSSPGA